MELDSYSPPFKGELALFPGWLYILVFNRKCHHVCWKTWFIAVLKSGNPAFVMCGANERKRSLLEKVPCLQMSVV